MTPFWDRELLRKQLRPISFKDAPHLTEIEKHYCSYYRIDKETRITGVAHRLGYFEAIGYRLACHMYTPPRPRGTVFVFHGYFDHVGLFGHLVEHLLRDGYAVVAYDLPGHGLSSGETVSIKNFAQYQSILEACLMLCDGHMPKPWMSVGQSTGGAVLIEYLFSNRFTPESSPFLHWAFLAPLVRPQGWRSVVMLHTLFGPFIRTWRRVFMVNSNDPEFIKFLKDKDPLQSRAVSIDWVGALRRWVKRIESTDPLEQPVTIVQGKEDTTVDWRHNVPQLQRLLPNAEVQYLETGRHQLVNESPEIRARVFGWISEAFDRAIAGQRSASVKKNETTITANSDKSGDRE
ncbi:alpha/beta hydrolase [Hahella sp. HN01]|uniref:alpha/beta hydrolase n=1 Tax=Hahella sp. HN01 TaxID=2847262 RepID=UPI001C1EBCED|nr:alpha/beta hydrolase [Hahella sp. HN01]MBU6950675.1 alpha/beta hydrolase [Hahella sp. HN01]